MSTLPVLQHAAPVVSLLRWQPAQLWKRQYSTAELQVRFEWLLHAVKTSARVQGLPDSRSLVGWYVGAVPLSSMPQCLTVCQLAVVCGRQCKSVSGVQFTTLSVWAGPAPVRHTRKTPCCSVACLVLQVQVEPLSSPNEGISVISLCRNNAKNAIGRQLLRELQEAINTLRQERTTRCVVVRSTCPGTFCAGADLKVRAASHEVMIKAGWCLSLFWRQLLSRLSSHGIGCGMGFAAWLADLHKQCEHLFNQCT